jgi:DNA-binding transcriptional MerR regulator
MVRTAHATEQTPSFETQSFEARSFQIHELARIAGVSIRALQHYGRLGLLQPVEGRGGAKTYTEADLQTLVQIVALKSVGVPLKRIRALRMNGSGELLQTLGQQRRAMERKRPLIDGMLFAVRNVEDALGRGEPPDPSVIRPLAEAMRRAPAPTTPRPPMPGVGRGELKAQWASLISETEAAGALDPASPAAQALAAKWARLMEVTTGGPGYRQELRPHAGVLSVAPKRQVAGGHAFEAIGPALALWAR